MDLSVDLAAAAEPARTVKTVSELTRAIRWLLEDEIGDVWVTGEISNHRKQGSGHQYFTLKDETSQLSCVLFRGNSSMAPRLEDGLCVEVYGRVTVYEARGQYQLIAELIQLRGAGALQAKFEALKRKLQAEGLFEAERKRPLPKFPTALGLVTSKTGAALRDMLNILERRAPWVRIFIAPVNVQGPSAAPDIADAIRKFSAGASIGWPEVDVIIAARGGGSIEDLWAFNEEIVARAIFEAERPVVSAVGHEIDFTISDFVADLRAPTPSAAAELVVPDTAALIAALANCRVSLGRRARELINAHALRVSRLRDGVLKREAKSLLREAAQRLDQRAAELRGNASAQLERLRNRLARSIDRLHAQRPQQRLAMETDRVRALRERLRVQTRHRLDRLRSGFQECAAKLRLLGPQSTLDRGYSVTMTSDGRVVRLANDVIAGDEIETRVSDGTLRSKVV